MSRSLADHEELRVIATRAKEGDRVAQGELLRRLDPLVQREARRYARLRRAPGMDLDDYRQIARVGILRALQTWRPDGLGIANYVIWWMRGRMKIAVEAAGPEGIGLVAQHDSGATIEPPDPAATPEAHLAALEEGARARAALRRAVERQSPRGRAAYDAAARYLLDEDLTYQGASESAGVSRARVQQCAARLVARLRASMGAERD